MVRLKFVIRSGMLVLRISEGKVRYYRKVHSFLIGNPDIKGNGAKSGAWDEL